MAQTNRLRGCYRRVLIFAVAIFAITALGGLFIYQRLGGIEGAKHWMAGRALKKIEAHLLKHRPDGVSQTEVESTFEKVRQENKEQHTDLIKLYQVLKDYLTRFHDTKPSDKEAIDFLINLESTILLPEQE